MSARCKIRSKLEDLISLQQSSQASFMFGEFYTVWIHYILYVIFMSSKPKINESEWAEQYKIILKIPNQNKILSEISCDLEIQGWVIIKDVHIQPLKLYLLTWELRNFRIGRWVGWNNVGWNKVGMVWSRVYNTVWCNSEQDKTAFRINRTLVLARLLAGQGKNAEPQKIFKKRGILTNM